MYHQKEKMFGFTLPDLIQIITSDKCCNFTFNYTKQTLTLQNHSELLTHKESELLYHLSQKKNEVLDRGFILNKLWGNDDFFNARSMDVFISKLRKVFSHKSGSLSTIYAHFKRRLFSNSSHVGPAPNSTIFLFFIDSKNSKVDLINSFFIYLNPFLLLISLH